MKRIAALVVVLAVLLSGWLTTPATLSDAIAVPEIGSDIEAQIAHTENTAAERFGLVPGTEKRITWQDAPGVPTDYAVVYIHGFSASRQEIAPVPRLVAEALGANLFETRLTGHGRLADPLTDTAAEAWLEDGVEALAIGAAIGERLVVIGTSTGATIALALARHELFANIDTRVLLSPNHGPSDPASAWLTRPFGPVLARAMVGEYREWQALNERQEEFWSTRYPTRAVVEMMRVVDLANARTPAATVPAALLIYSPEDRVVSVDKLKAAFASLPAGRKAEFASTETDDPGRHVLAGDILSPSSTQPTVERIRRFVTNSSRQATQDVRPSPEVVH